MKQFKRVCSLALALALVMSLAAVGASAASEPYYLTHDEALEYISLQINTDLEDDTVYIDSEDALEYYDPYWEQTRLNTGYHALERDTSITVTHLPGNPAGDSAYIYIVLVPYSQQADGSYVSALKENTFYEMWADGDPYTDTDYIYYCTDGNFHPLSEFADNSEGAMQYGYGFADYQSASLAPGESVTFALPFDRFGDDLMYEVQAIMNYPDGPDSTYNSFRISRVKLDEAAVAQMRAEQAPVAGFSDVHAGDYFAEAVEWAKENGITGGTTSTTFSPDSSVTRAQAVTFLWRAAGTPEPASLTSSFTDVADQSAYYYKAVLWATEQGITNGVSDTSFGADNAVTYDQMLAFLARAAGADTGDGDWSQAALGWAADNGLTDGLTFSAKDACPRSDVVYCLWQQMA